MKELETLRDLKNQFQLGKLTKPEFILRAQDIHSHLFNYVEITQSTEVCEISINRKGVSFLMGQEKIRVFAPAGEMRVAPIEAMNFGVYEPEESRVIDLLASSASQILDVGANIGWYTTRFAKQNPTAKVHAFEPVPVTYSYLQRNVAENNLGTQVLTYNYGLSDSSGSCEFFIAPTAGTNASLLNVAGAANASKIVGLTLTLDQWCTNQQVRPDFIKCDVEGAELLVFRGGKGTLTRDTPIVFSELLRKWSRPFGYHPNDMLSFFSSIDYRCYAIGSSGVRQINEVTDETSETNYAFLHIKNHKQAISMLEHLK